MSTISYNDVHLSNNIDTILTFIEGTFGALLMMLLAAGAALSVPLCIGIGAWLAIKKKHKGWKAYTACVLLPIVLFTLATAMFILRSITATFFAEPLPPQSSYSTSTYPPLSSE